MKLTKITVEVPVYRESFQFNWTEDFNISTSVAQGTIKIVLNKEGLLSMANHLLNLAQDEIPSGYHLHLDEHNSLTEGSVELIIEKEI